MKIALINKHPSDVLGGSEIQCDLIASQMTRFGHTILYLAAPPNKKIYNTPYETIALNSFRFLNLLQTLRKKKPEVLYWRHNRKGLLAGLIAAKILGIRFIYSMSHINDAHTWTRNPITREKHNPSDARDWLRFISNKIQSIVHSTKNAVSFKVMIWLADGVVSLNEDFLRLIPVRRKTAIHNSMSNEAELFNWKRPYVAWVANIKPAKNPEEYIRLANACASTGVDFLMIGKIQNPKYSYLTEKNSLPPNLIYLGAKTPSQVNGILRNSLFLAHTCNPEGFGNNFIQAWLQGKPTITLHFDPEGIIEKERIGFYSRTFSNFTENVKRLIENEAIRKEMGHRARIYATARFSTENNVRQLEDFIKRL